MENTFTKVYKRLLSILDLREEREENGDVLIIRNSNNEILSDYKSIYYSTSTMILEDRYSIGFPRYADGILLYGDGSILFSEKGSKDIIEWGDLTEASEEMILDVLCGENSDNNKEGISIDDCDFSKVASSQYGDEWEDCSYEPIYADNGELYQFYGFKDSKTGQRYVQIAKYIAKGEYLPLEEVLPYFSNNKDTVERLF